MLSDREKVLFIAFQYPPMGGPGVHRSLNLTKHLRTFGFEPIVLTIDYESIEKGDYVVDHSLLQSIPVDLSVIRVPSYERIRFTRISRKLYMFRLFWFFLYPFFWEKSARWPIKVYNQASKIVREQNIKIVYTSSGPFSSIFLGLRLQKKLRVRWVADLRDPFTDAYAWSFPSRLHWRIARAVEKRVLELPDVLVVNTLAVKRLYSKRGIRENRETVVINNGF